MARWIIVASFVLATAIVGGMAFFASQGEPEVIAADVASGEPGLTPVPTAAFLTILNNKSDKLTIRRLQENPAILIFDYARLVDQGRALNRIAALIEKVGLPRDRVVSEEELQSYIEARGEHADTFFYGHDYKADDLARFFTLAAQAPGGLREAEKALLDRLVAEGMVAGDAQSGYRSAVREGALVSLVQVQADDPSTALDETVDAGLRETILRHELSHGEFFTNADYRSYCTEFWKNNLSQDERLSFRVFLNNAGYDPQNETIMVNEMQAFLMNTPDTRAFTASMVQFTEETLQLIRKKFLAGGPPTKLFSPDHPIAGPLLATSQ